MASRTDIVVGVGGDENVDLPIHRLGMGVVLAGMGNVAQNSQEPKGKDGNCAARKRHGRQDGYV